MFLQKCFLLKKIYRKDFWINTSFWLSNHNAEPGKKLKDSNGKSDGFPKVNKRTEGTGEYAYNFYGLYLRNYWFALCFPGIRKTFPSN